MSEKKCNKCKETKNTSEFNNNSKNRDGKCFQCRECDSRQSKIYYKTHKEERLIANKVYQDKNPNVYRNSRYKLRYGITVEEYSEMLNLQGGVCAICKKPEKRYNNLVVDHDHKTGIVRGLLCSNCNNALGNVFDNVEILQNMSLYLISNS